MRKEIAEKWLSVTTLWVTCLNLLELTLIYDDSEWDFIVIHANRAQQPYKSKFLRNE